MNKTLEHNESLGQRMRRLRESLNMTQRELAEDICTPGAVSQIENGYINPTYRLLEALLRRMGSSVRDLGADANDINLSIDLARIRLFVQKAEYSDALEHIHEIEDLLTLDEQVRSLSFDKAECLLRLGRTQEAVELLKSMEHKANRLSEETKNYTIAKMYNMIGTAYYIGGDIISAYVNYSQADRAQLYSEDLLKGHILYNLGKVASLLQNYEQAIALFTTAEKIYTSFKSTNIRYIADTYYQLGVACTSVHHYHKAIEYFHQAQALYDSADAIRMSIYVQVSYSQALAKEDPDKAMNLLHQCCQRLKKLDDVPELLFALTLLASIALDQGDLSKSRTNLIDVKEIVEHVSVSDTRVATYHQVNARCFFEEKKYALAVGEATRSSDLFSKMGLSKESATSLEWAMRAYEAQEDIHNAYKTSKRIIELQNYEGLKEVKFT